MSSTSTRPRLRGDGTGRGTDPAAVDTTAALDALDDPDCRRLLEATAEEAMTASELIAACDIPRSTTYRKVDRLVGAGLLEERVRISPDGKHASEYRRAFEDVVVSISDGGVDVEPSRPTAREE